LPTTFEDVIEWFGVARSGEFFRQAAEKAQAGSPCSPEQKSPYKILLHGLLNLA